MRRPTATSQSLYQSWGRTPQSSPARVVPLSWRDRLPPLDSFEKPLLAYGQGRSYGDACLNNGGILLDTRSLDRFISFDAETGCLRAEAGVTLAEVLALCIPHGWFLPVTPGTKFVTLGGAVANDVHGKNHHVAGTFGRHVTRLELVRSSGRRIELTPEYKLFRATVAGLGLTGLITWVEMQLQPIDSAWIDVETTRFRSLEAFFALSKQANKESQYVVAWFDAFRPEGRGLLMQGDHATKMQTSVRSRKGWRPAIPFDLPGWVLNAHTARAFNALYYRKQQHDVKEKRVSYESFFYPLDAVRDWNRAYGRRGFFQYQCVIPFSGETSDAIEATRAVLNQVAQGGSGSFLTVLKTFGDASSPGLMSFPCSGVTLALDIPNRGEETVRLLRSLDDRVREAGGAVYPAKDACMTPESFRAFYPRWESFAEFVDPAFSSSFWRRVTGEGGP